MNLRANVDDGKVTKDGELKYRRHRHAQGREARIVIAGAYTNSVKGTKETTLYDIDGTIGALVKQAPPNDGVLNAVGKLGIKADTAAFDIWSDGTKNDAWLMTGDTLYSVDLMTGKATEAAKITGVSGTVQRHRDPPRDVSFYSFQVQTAPRPVPGRGVFMSKSRLRD